MSPANQQKVISFASTEI